MHTGGQPLLVPRENHRVKTMSMGYFMEGDEPAVWRGPMVSSAFDKMAIGTDWGALDVLVVDMPPGGSTVCWFAAPLPHGVGHLW